MHNVHNVRNVHNVHSLLSPATSLPAHHIEGSGVNYLLPFHPSGEFLPLSRFAFMDVSRHREAKASCESQFFAQRTPDTAIIDFEPILSAMVRRSIPSLPAIS